MIGRGLAYLNQVFRIKPTLFLLPTSDIFNPNLAQNNIFLVHKRQCLQERGCVAAAAAVNERECTCWCAHTIT